MLLSNKIRTSAATQTEQNAFNPVIGLDPIPSELIPAIDFSNYINAAITLTYGNQANKTGITGYLTQEAIDQLMTQANSGDFKLASIYNNGATNTILGTALKAVIADGGNGSGYVTAPVVVVTLQGADTTNGATAPSYTANIAGGLVTSLTQTSAGSGLTQTPLITFNNTGTGGSGAAAYIILTNNWLDDRLINPNGGVVTKLVNDLANNYSTTSQVNALITNYYQSPNWFEDFDGEFGAAISAGPAVNITAGATTSISRQGYVIRNNGSISSPQYFSDYYRDNSANTVAGDLPPGILTFAGTSNAFGINQVLANQNQSVPANYVRDIRFRFRLATPGGAFSSTNTLYFGVTGSDFSTTAASFLTNAAYFSFGVSCTATNDSAALGSGSIITNFSSLNSQTVTSGTTGFPSNARNFNTYRIVYDGTQFIFYINNTQILNTSVLSNTTKVYPFMAVSAAGGSYGSVPIVVDYINNKVTLPNARI